MQALVTGATGFLGSHICRRLLEEGHGVRALVRETSDRSLIEDLDVEPVVGDVTDPASLGPAVEGCDAVFHLAGVVSFWRALADRLWEVNVEGTRHVVQACLAADVDRLVHTASVAALGYDPDGGQADEETPFNWPDRGFHYMRTKHAGQQVVLDAVAEEGLDAVVVNPSTILGPGDLNKNGGQLVRVAVMGGGVRYPTGGTNLVDVRDVADGHLRALEKGRSGERYVLAGDDLSYREFFQLCTDELGSPPPKEPLSYPLALTFAAFDELKARFTGRHPRYPKDTVRSLFTTTFYSAAKAEEELGFSARPVRTSVRETYDWYVEHGMLRPVEASDDGDGDGAGDA